MCGYTRLLAVAPALALTSAILQFGRTTSWWAAFCSMLAFLSTAALFYARFEIGRILSPPPEVTLVPERCERLEQHSPAFWLVFQTRMPEEFRLRLSDHHLSAPLEPDIHQLSHANADTRFEDLQDAFGPDESAWEFKLVRPVSFLGRPLRDNIVLRLPFLGVRQDADDAYHRLFPPHR